MDPIPSPTILYAVPVNPKLPASVIVVAWLFIAFAILSAIDIIVSLFFQRLSLNFGVLFIFIGRGLLNRSNTARLWALTLSWIGAFGLGCISLVALIAPSGLYYSVNGHRTLITSPAATAAAVAIPLVMSLVCIWQIWVLTRPTTRNLFLAKT